MIGLKARIDLGHQNKGKINYIYSRENAEMLFLGIDPTSNSAPLKIGEIISIADEKLEVVDIHVRLCPEVEFDMNTLMDFDMYNGNEFENFNVSISIILKNTEENQIES